MFLLAFVFCLLLCLIVGAVLIATRPTTEQSAVRRRIEQIMISQTGRADEVSALPTYLDLQKVGMFTALDAMLAKNRMTRSLQRLIVQGQTSTTMAKTLTICVCGALAALVAAYLLLSAPLPALACAGFAGYLPIGVLQFKRAQRLTAFNDALPDAIDMFTRSLRVGNSLVASIGIVAEESIEPAKTEFAEVFKKQNYGLPLREALMQMLERVPSMDLQVVVTAILVQKDSGGNLVEILERSVAVIRDRLRIQREIRTHTAQGRMTGWILCLLPVFLMICLNLLNPGYSSVLFNDPFGQKLLYIGIGLVAFGALLIRQIVNGIEA